MNELIKAVEPTGKLTSKGITTASRLCDLLEQDLAEQGVTARDYYRFHEFIGSGPGRQLEYDTPQGHIGALIEKVREGLTDALILNIHNKEYKITMREAGGNERNPIITAINCGTDKLLRLLRLLKNKCK